MVWSETNTVIYKIASCLRLPELITAIWEPIKNLLLKLILISGHLFWNMYWWACKLFDTIVKVFDWVVKFTFDKVLAGYVKLAVHVYR